MGQEQSTPSEGSEDPNTISGPCRANATVLGLVADPKLQRDSLTSVRIGRRQFWTARDSTCFDGQPFFFFTSTASWTDFDINSRPDVKDGELRTHGDNKTTYFPPGSNQFPPHGNSGNGQERWLMWPDSPPLPVTTDYDNTVKLYTWIKNVYQNPKGEVNTDAFPSTSLYRSEHRDHRIRKNALPSTSLINNTFWPRGSIPYGSYGWVLGTNDGHVYLYGQGLDDGIALARAPLDRIEDPKAYTFYSHATDIWTARAPAPSDAGAVIPNAGTGQQGTYYFSRYFERYIWIGGRSPCNSEFQIATAPEPWGPWTEPRTFYVAPPGEKFAGYSWQAHPGLSEGLGHGKDIYLTFTRINRYYETVLIRVEWH